MTRYRLHDSLGYNLSLASRIQERRLDEGLRTLGLTRTTWCILLAVGNEGLHQPSDIALFVGIDRTATSRALRKMEGDGLVRRATGPGDRRTTKVTLTDSGVALIERGTRFAIANNAVMHKKLGPEDVAHLKDLLERVNAGEKTGLAVL